MYMAEKRFLYRDGGGLGCFSEMKVYRENESIVFNYTEMTDDSGHNDSCRRIVDVGLYKEGIEKLLRTGQCDLGSVKFDVVGKFLSITLGSLIYSISKPRLDKFRL